jgi:hypothetical protein
MKKPLNEFFLCEIYFLYRSAVYKKRKIYNKNVEEKCKDSYLIIELHTTLLENFSVNPAVAQVQVYTRRGVRHCVQIQLFIIASIHIAI